MKARALLLSASIGRGHEQANHAMEAALRKACPQLETECADALRYLNPLERFATAGIYALSLRYAPSLYRKFYNWTDGGRKPSVTTNLFGSAGIKGMIKDLQAFKPNLVISSYPTTVPLAVNAAKRIKLDFFNALVVTDYYAHHHWARPESDVLMVANAETAENLYKIGIQESKVVITGIPIALAYKNLIHSNKRELKIKYGFEPDVPLILISGGGTGSYRALNYVIHTISNLGIPVQVLIFSGKKDKELIQSGKATIYKLAFTKHFPELMAASDILVGKAGGLTISEAAALGKPMVVYEPIPGQEEYNTDYLVRHGAAIWVKERNKLRAAILQTLDTCNYLAMSQAASLIGSPNAANKIAQTLLKRMNN